MEENLDIEYCYNCDEFYALNSVVWLMFKSTSGESLKSSESVFECVRCGLPILRYGGYLEALERRESEDFINDLLSDIDDLSDESLSELRFLLANFTVPSFSLIIEGNDRSKLSELVRKRYITLNWTTDFMVVTLNAYKLQLMDYEELLTKMSYQRPFIENPEWLPANDNEPYLRRKKRLSALPNDFTEDDKAELLRDFNGKCALTGKEVPIQIDHVIPVAVGHGGTTKSNMLPVWQRINSSKSDRNIFEWYKQNGERFGVCPQLFERAIKYLAELNGMTIDEYKTYVYECHTNPIDILAEGDSA